MTRVEHALGEFAAAWKAGRRPRIEQFVARLDPSDREEFLELVDAWLELAPDPVYDEGTRTRIAGESDVAAVVHALREDRTLWPDLLPRLRERRGLSLRELSHLLVEVLALPAATAADESRLAGWLERMETDRVDPDGVTRRVLCALGDTLGVSATTLEDAGDVRGWRPATAGGLLWRADVPAQAQLGAQLDALAAAGAMPAPDHDSAGTGDDVDALFTAGRGG